MQEPDAGRSRTPAAASGSRPVRLVGTDHRTGSYSLLFSCDDMPPRPSTAHLMAISLLAQRCLGNIYYYISAFYTSFYMFYTCTSAVAGETFAIRYHRTEVISEKLVGFGNKSQAKAMKVQSDFIIIYRMS